jgi:hypothetical protein
VQAFESFRCGICVHVYIYTCVYTYVYTHVSMDTMAQGISGNEYCSMAGQVVQLELELRQIHVNGVKTRTQ